MEEKEKEKREAEEDREENKERTDTEMRVGRVKASGRGEGEGWKKTGKRRAREAKREKEGKFENCIQKVETKKKGRRREKWRNG